MSTQTRHPLIALWVHPRSMSTATERIMRSRGDLTCFHEPFLYHYYIDRQMRDLAHFDVDSSRPVRYADIRDSLISASEHRPVFLKDMAYYVVPRILDDDNFIKRIRHVFLVRDPRKALLSYHRLDPDFAPDELGFSAQLTLHQRVIDLCDADPIVLEAETLQKDPANTLKGLWARLDLPDSPDALKWDAKAPVPEDWKAVAGWHTAVIESTGIRPPQAEDDEETIASRTTALLGRHPELERVLETHQTAYDALRTLARQSMA